MMRFFYITILFLYSISLYTIFICSTPKKYEDESRAKYTKRLLISYEKDLLNKSIMQNRKFKSLRELYKIKIDVRFEDNWNTDYFFDQNRYLIFSAGPDRKYHTSDDIYWDTKERNLFIEECKKRSKEE